MATERGWSMTELAQRSGLSLRVLYYLRDGRQPSTETMQSLMRLFPEVPFEALFVSVDSAMVQRLDTSAQNKVAA
jgi:transcriptional regulator with XRE-family HTH domain